MPEYIVYQIERQIGWQKNLLEYMSGRMPGRMSARMSDRVPDRMPDRMS